VVITSPDAITSSSSSNVTAILYDADGSDRPVRLGEFSLKDLKKHQLLWIDVELDGDAHADELSDVLGLESAKVQDEAGSSDRPRLDVFEDYFRLTLVGLNEEEDRPFRVQALVGDNWVITAHQQSFDLMGSFNGPFKGETRLGQLDGAVFLATLLNWLLNGYYHLVEEVEGRIDELDEKLLTREVDRGELLGELVALRRRITRVRRILAPHRDAFATLAEPESTLTVADSSTTFQRLYTRLEKAIESLDGARDMLVGSFDIAMTQAAQRTNEVVKTLTVLSVLLLPAIVVAGIMGMNFRVPLFDEPNLFWVTIVGMAALAMGTVLVARWRNWI
jgi:magnesium transporter